MNFVIRILLNALALAGVAWLIGGVEVVGLEAALWAGLLLGLFNALLKPVLKLLTLPVNILTLGLFGLVINGFLFWLAGELVEGFVVRGPWSAFWGAILMAIFSALLAILFGVKKDSR